MKDWVDRLLLVGIIIGLILIIFGLVYLFTFLGVKQAEAAEKVYHWTNPEYAMPYDSCMTDTTQRLLDPIYVDIRLVRFSDNDTLWLPRFLSSGQGAADSVNIETLDGTMGTAEFFSVHDGVRSCFYASYLFASPYSEAPKGLLATYYASSAADTTAWGDPVASELVSTLDFDWGLGGPVGNILIDNWAARWTGIMEIPADGFYYYYLRTKDGSRFWIDNYWLLSWWGFGAEKEQSVGIELTKGPHTVRVDYLAGSGNASAHLSWSGPDITKQIIPATVLHQP